MDLIERYRRESTQLEEQIVDLCYFMKGGLEWNSAWELSYRDRETIVKVLNRRIKEQNPSGKEYM